MTMNPNIPANQTNTTILDTISGYINCGKDVVNSATYAFSNGVSGFYNTTTKTATTFVAVVPPVILSGLGFVATVAKSGAIVGAFIPGRLAGALLVDATANVRKRDYQTTRKVCLQAAANIGIAAALNWAGNGNGNLVPAYMVIGAGIEVASRNFKSIKIVKE